MMHAYITQNGRITRLEKGADVAEAVWIDLVQPSDEEVEALRQIGIDIPTLEDMEEIEISNRLYREDGLDYMTAVLPGERGDGERAAMPVSFILSAERLVTVRHHSPRPFLTYPERGERSTLGCRGADRLFIGLLEEIIARLADILEGSGKVLDVTMASIFEGQASQRPEHLQKALQKVGTEAEVMANVRLGLLTLERIIAFYTVIVEDRPDTKKLRPVLRSQFRDIQALEVHADFLSTRVSLTVDTTLGMINLQQSSTVRILSVIAALFLPPTLIASIYGMNFTYMPELDKPWGYPMALGLMVMTPLMTWLLLRWKKWL